MDPYISVVDRALWRYINYLENEIVRLKSACKVVVPGTSIFRKYHYMLDSFEFEFKMAKNVISPNACEFAWVLPTYPEVKVEALDSDGFFDD